MISLGLELIIYKKLASKAMQKRLKIIKYQKFIALYILLWESPNSYK